MHYPLIMHMREEVIGNKEEVRKKLGFAEFLFIFWVCYKRGEKFEKISLE